MIAQPGRGERCGLALVRRCLLALLVLATTGWGQHARAQTPTFPAVLTAVSATEQPGGQTLVLLTFQPLAPRFSIINNDSTSPSIALALSSRGLTASAPQGLHGLLRFVAFDQQNNLEILHFSTSVKARITAAPVGTTAISLTLAPSTLAAPPPVTAGPVGLPQSVDRCAGRGSDSRSCS